ncbi:MAG TPA: hypothetical protein VNV18_16740 [Stellaceae bacterium]|jgi:hypothetical protein|nr:hypothetical protein [Stellaceae bacterium]
MIARHQIWRAAAGAIPFALALGLVVRLYSGLGDGQLFDEDYAVYLQQAWNIAHHVKMAQMGVIQPLDLRLPLTDQSPLIYPPLLPLLYAVPVSIWQFDLHAFKMIQLSILLLTLVLFCHAMRKWRFSILETSVSLVVFATSYEIRRSVNTIDADIPFLFLMVWALLVVDAAISARGRGRHLWGVAAGAAIFVAVNMRTVGVVLLPALVVADTLRARRWRPAVTVVPVATIALLWLCQRLALGPNEAYSYILHYRFFTVITNIRGFYWAIAASLRASPVFHLELAIFLALSALALVALAREAMRGAVLAVFVVAYTGLLLILPDFAAGCRYLLPQLLVLGAFAVRGAAIVSAAILRTGRPGVAPVAAGALAIFFAAFVPAPLPAGEWGFGATAAPARQLFAFVRQHTPPDAVVAAMKYRSLHLFTQRTTMRIPPAASPQALIEELRRDRVSAVVVKYSPPAQTYDFTDCPALPFCRPAALGSEARQVFRNRDYAVFAIAPSEN